MAGIHGRSVWPLVGIQWGWIEQPWPLVTCQDRIPLWAVKAHQGWE